MILYLGTFFVTYFLGNLKLNDSEAFTVAWSIASRRSVVGSKGLDGMAGSDFMLLVEITRRSTKCCYIVFVITNWKMNFISKSKDDFV